MPYSPQLIYQMSQHPLSIVCTSPMPSLHWPYPFLFVNFIHYKQPIPSPCSIPFTRMLIPMPTPLSKPPHVHPPPFLSPTTTTISYLHAWKHAFTAAHHSQPRLTPTTQAIPLHNLFTLMLVSSLRTPLTGVPPG